MHKLFALSLVALLSGTSTLPSAPVDAVNFSESIYVSSADIGLTTGIAWAPDGSGRLFVIRKGGFSGQQNAQVRVVQNGAVLPEVFATESVFTNSECGLIGMAFDPDFLNNRFVYFFVTISAAEQQIIRYTDLADGAQRAASRTVIVPGLPTTGNNHDGGGVGIGNDGKLYFAVGDLGSGAGVNADLLLLAAKVGRVNRFTGAAANDNPFFGQGNANTDKVWARGFRNPFTFTFQSSTGELWVNSVGTAWEQVFVPGRGDHAGYNAYENNQPAGFLTPVIAYRTNGTETRSIAGSGAVRAGGVATFTTTSAHPFRKGAMATIGNVADASFNGTFAVASVPSPTQFTVVQPGADQPTSGGGTATTQAIGGAITGGCFYESTAFPAAFRGNFFFGDYNSGRIMRVPLDAANEPSRTEEFVNNIGSHVDMATGPDGALYYANQSNPGTIRRLARTGTGQNLIVYPTALSVVEGGSSVVSVRLNSPPPANVSVTIQRVSGDTDLSVSSGASLIFTPANFATPQLATLAAAQDADIENDSALFRVSAPGITSYDVLVNGIDNDEPQLVVSTGSIQVNEGGSNSFTVRLANAPAGVVAVNSARTAGSTDVTVSAGSTLTFTPLNFATPQTVTLAAAQDGDNVNDNAIVTVSAAGETSRNIAVTVLDNDPLAPAFTSSPVLNAVDDSPYTYDANATGNPAPTFALTAAPPGMSIDSATGVILWTPSNPGTFGVSVRASNGVLPNATQSFSITVRADAPPVAILTRPIEGEIMSGTNAEFFGDGIDDVGTLQAEFFVDDVLRSTDVNSGNHFHFGGAHTLFDTTQYTNGAHTLRMRVTDTRGQPADAEAQVTIGNGGGEWQDQYFSPGDPNRSFTADPNADGESNLFEYFTGSNPTIGDVSRAPVAAIADLSGTKYLTLRFIRANWVNDVTARVEVTGDLVNGPWAQIDPTDPTYLVSVQNNIPAFGLQTVTVRDVVAAGANPRFMRLRLTRP